MRIFARTSLSWIVIFLAARVYMTNFQSDALYSFLNLTNPATQALETINKKIDVFGSGFDTQLQDINTKLDTIINSSENNSNTGTSTGSIVMT